MWQVIDNTGRSKGTPGIGWNVLDNTGNIKEVSSVSALNSEAFVTIGNSAGLSAERALTTSVSNIITDNGANSSVIVERAALTGDATATQNSNALTLATVNSNVGTFGTSTQVGTFTVNAKGLTTAASNTSIQITESQVTNLTTDLDAKVNKTDTLALTGDVTVPASALTGPANSFTATLATVNPNVGTFGSSTAVGVFTVNAKGLITAASNATISGSSGALDDLTDVEITSATTDDILVFDGNSWNNEAPPFRVENIADSGTITWTKDLDDNLVYAETVNQQLPVPGQDDQELIAMNGIWLTENTTPLTVEDIADTDTIVWTKDKDSGAVYAETANQQLPVSGKDDQRLISMRGIWLNENTTPINVEDISDSGTVTWTKDLDSGAVYAETYNQPLPTPEGRLTLVSGTAVQTSDQSAKTSVFYTPYLGNWVLVHDGFQIIAKEFKELTLALDNNAAHTGYHQSGKNFDFFIYWDRTTAPQPTMRLVTGPAWTSDTARATAIQLANGFYVNAASMTARYDTSTSTLTININEGIYVGTMRASANGQCSVITAPAAAANFGVCQIYLWNMYNRVVISGMSKISTDSWTYAAGLGWRKANSGTAETFGVVIGISEDMWVANYTNLAAVDGAAAGGQLVTGVGLDSTTAFTGFTTAENSKLAQGALNVANIGQYIGLPGLGYHQFQPLENEVDVRSISYGDAGTPTTYQTGLWATGTY